MALKGTSFLIEGNSRLATALLLKVGPMDQQHQHPLGAWEKCISSGLTPDLTESQPARLTRSLDNLCLLVCEKAASSEDRGLR